MSILSVFDVIEVIWTPQNTYLIKMVSNSRVTRAGVVDHVVWLFCKSTVDRLISTLESDYYDVHRGLRSGFVSNTSGHRVTYTFWHPWTPPKYLKNEVATKLTSELFVCLKLTQVSEGVYCTCGMIWRCFRTFEWSIGTVGPVLHVYLICFWRDWGHLDTPKFIKMASNSRVTRTGVVGRAVWLFFTRVRCISKLMSTLASDY